MSRNQDLWALEDRRREEEEEEDEEESRLGRGTGSPFSRVGN